MISQYWKLLYLYDVAPSATTCGANPYEIVIFELEYSHTTIVHQKSSWEDLQLWKSSKDTIRNVRARNPLHMEKTEGNVCIR